MKFLNYVLIHTLIGASSVVWILFWLDLGIAYLSEAYTFSSGEIHLRGFAMSCPIFIVCAIISIFSSIPKNRLRIDLLSFVLMYGCYFFWTFINSTATWVPYALIGLGTLGGSSFLILFWKYVLKNSIISIYSNIQKKAKDVSVQKQTTKKPVLIITPLLGAVITGDLDLVRTALADHPEELNTAYAQNGNTPLHVATLNGYTEIVRLLLQQPGIDTTRTNNEGKTALDLAREKGFTEIAQLLAILLSPSSGL